MKKYVKYLGTKHLNGMYFTKGLTEDSFYLFVDMSPKENFVIVINNEGVECAYSKELFEE